MKTNTQQKSLESIISSELGQGGEMGIFLLLVYALVMRLGAVLLKFDNCVSLFCKKERQRGIETEGKRERERERGV